MLTIRSSALRAAIFLALAAIACTGSVAGVADPVAVTITPPSATLLPLGEQAFSASVVGAPNTGVTWTVAEGAAGGTVNGSGAYTAPNGFGLFHVVATSVAAPSKSAVASVIVWDGVDVCGGLVQDKLAHPMTAVAKPAPGQSFADPQFGTTIRRISDAAAGGVLVVKPVYSTIQAWNADESYLVLYHTDGSPSGHFLYDGHTYAKIKQLDVRPADLEQVYWDTTDPKILYYTDIVTKKLHRFNVDTDTHATSTVLRDFSLAPVSCASDLLGGSDPMWTSWNSRFFGYTCGRGTTSKKFVYDKQTDTIGSIVVKPGSLAPQPSPSGALFYYNPADATLAEVYDSNMGFIRTLDVAAGEHATLGVADGVDTHFSVQFDIAPYGTVIATDMTTGSKRVIVGESNGWGYPPNGTHLSALAYKRPGWLAVSVVGSTSGAGLLDQEVLLVNANTGGTVCRVAHHRSAGGNGPNGYWAEPHATISPTGTRILFASDWGGQSLVETYVVELPGYSPP